MWLAMRRRGEGCFKWKFQALQLGDIAYTRGAILGARVDGGHQGATTVKVGFHILFLSRKLLVDLRHDLIAIFVTARHCEQHCSSVACWAKRQRWILYSGEKAKFGTETATAFRRFLRASADACRPAQD